MYIERVDAGDIEEGKYKTDRIAVPGGWIYRTMTSNSRREAGVACHSSMIFIPDAEVGRQ